MTPIVIPMHWDATWLILGSAPPSIVIVIMSLFIHAYAHNANQALRRDIEHLSALVNPSLLGE